MAGPKTRKKLQKKVTSSGGWGMFDTIASVSQGNKEAKKHAQSMTKTANEVWNNKHTGTALNNAINQGADEGGWNAKDEQVTITGEKVTATKDPEKIPKKVIEDKKKKVFTVGNMQVSERLHNLYQRLLDRGYSSKDAEQIIKLGLAEEKFSDENLVDLMSGEGIKKLGSLALGAGGIMKGALTKQPYENEFLGSAGAANILNKIKNAKTEEEKQRIMNATIAANPEGFKQMFDKEDYPGQITLRQFEDRLVASNEGNKNFDKNYNKTAGAFWELNPPSTQGDMVDLANQSRQEGFEWTKQNTQIVQEARELASRQGQGLASLGGGGGGGGGGTDTDPDANLMPSGTYLASQYNKALVPDQSLDPYQNAMYTGGPEQRHIAGGYWDPDSGQWVGSPWGTENLWQGANPPINVAEGGPIRAPSSKVTQGGGGLFDFKPYGF